MNEAKTNQLQYYIETNSSLPGITIVDGSVSGTTIPSKLIDSHIDLIVGGGGGIYTEWSIDYY